MSTDAKSDMRHVRRYLLGALSEDEADALEIQLLENPHMNEELLGEEERLIDEFVHGTLPPSERLLFERRFLDKKRRDDVALTSLLKAKFSQAAITTSMRPARAGRMVAIAAAVALVVGSSVVAYRTASIRSDARAHEALDTERRLAAQMVAERDTRIALLEGQLTLNQSAAPPITIDRQVRSSASFTITVPAAGDVVRLAFNLSNGMKHDAYRVVLFARAPNGQLADVWSADVPAIRLNAGTSVAEIAVPRGILSPGAYLAQIAGRYPDERDATEFELRIVAQPR